MPVFGKNGVVMGTGGAVGYPCCCDQPPGCPTNCPTCPGSFTISFGIGDGFPCNSIDLAKSVVMSQFTDVLGNNCNWNGSTYGVPEGDPSAGIVCYDGMWHVYISVCWFHWQDPATGTWYTFSGGYGGTLGNGPCPDPSKLIETQNDLGWSNSIDVGDCTFTGVSVA